MKATILLGTPRTSGLPKMEILCAIVLASQMSVPAYAQERRPPDGSRTIFEALTTSGFDEAARAPGAPDAHRTLTSSAFQVNADVFAAGYYYADETSQESLGPLHVSLFDRGNDRWIHAPSVPEAAGSVMDVGIAAEYVIVNTRQSPSAGRGLVFRRANLELVAALPGFHLQEMPGGLIRYTANMVHFAPTHQMRLMVFHPPPGTSIEVFPGMRESELAASYRRRVRTAYASLPAAEREESETSNHGPVDDFDRHFRQVAHAADGRRLVLVVSYGSRLPAQVKPKPFETVVWCALLTASSWSCEEHEIGALVRTAGFPIQRADNGMLTIQSVDALIRAALSGFRP